MNETQNVQKNQTFFSWALETPLRKNLTILIYVFIALALITKTVLYYRQAEHVGKSDQYAQSVTVTGEAEEYVKPDTLQFNITVNEEGKDVSEATKKSGEKITAAIKILKDNGVEEKNIKTTNYSVQDTYSDINIPCEKPYNLIPSVTKANPTYVPICDMDRKITGATVYQTLEIKIRDIEKNATEEKRSNLVTALAAANIKIENITFTVFDMTEIKKKVRSEAIKNAKKDAKVLEKDLNTKLEHITGFSEQGGGYNPYMSARAIEPMMMKDSAVTTSGAQLPTGEQKITSTVSITYLLK